MPRRIISVVLVVMSLCLLLCPSATAVPIISENKQEIYDYLTQKMECSPAVACGIMANLQAVSGYNPEAARKEPKSKGSTEKIITAYGLCQWTADRWKALQKFDPEYNTVDAQLRFLNYEFLTSEIKAWPKVMEHPDTMEGAYDAAVSFAKCFLRLMQYYDGVDQFALVGSIAQELYAEQTGTPVPTPPTPPTPVDPGGTGGGDFLRLPETGTYTDGMFLDVSAKAWYNGGVSGAVRFGLMKGQTDKIFSPAGNVTIAEAVTMASRLHCIYTNGVDTIKQTSGQSWYKVYVDYAVSNGIVAASYKNKTMAQMNKSASRAEMAVIIDKAMPAEALIARNTIADNAIPDVKVSASYGSAVYKLYRAGILNGSGTKGEFLPWNSINRAEMATIMSRMADTDNRVSFALK